MGLFVYDADDVVGAVEEWQAKCSTEEEYEDSLARHLNGKFGKPIFHRQYFVGKSRADIFVQFQGGAAVAIEVKCNLVDRLEYLRLIGQIYEYLNVSDVELVIVLCGENDPSIEKLIRDAVSFFNEHHGNKVRFVTVGAGLKVR
jgi:hypothetical protein